MMLVGRREECRGRMMQRRCSQSASERLILASLWFAVLQPQHESANLCIHTHSFLYSPTSLLV